MDDLTLLLEDPAIRNRANLARVCGVSKQASSKWKRLPADYCRKVEAETEGRWSRYRLRPDVFGDRPPSDDDSKAA